MNVEHELNRLLYDCLSGDKAKPISKIAKYIPDVPKTVIRTLVAEMSNINGSKLSRCPSSCVNCKEIYATKKSCLFMKRIQAYRTQAVIDDIKQKLQEITCVTEPTKRARL